MKVIGIIPARYASSRFPGKPLADICGKPMIWWVYQQAVKVQDFAEVYVATDDERIIATAETFGGKAIMTSDKHSTGTDRTAEVAEKIPADWYVNIQGDEPIISPDVIQKVIPQSLNNEFEVINLMCKIVNPIEFINSTVPKVLVNDEDIAVYITRTAAPYPKGSIEYANYKQVCVYGFSRSALKFFSMQPRGRLETIEDIEILRFVENGYRVKFIEVESDAIAVDTLNDIEKVRKIIGRREGLA